MRGAVQLEQFKPAMLMNPEIVARYDAILDVLKNYTAYKLAFKLANEGKEPDEKEVARRTDVHERLYSEYPAASRPAS